MCVKRKNKKIKKFSVCFLRVEWALNSEKGKIKKRKKIALGIKNRQKINRGKNLFCVLCFYVHKKLNSGGSGKRERANKKRKIVFPQVLLEWMFMWKKSEAGEYL